MHTAHHVHTLPGVGSEPPEPASFQRRGPARTARKGGRFRPGFGVARCCLRDVQGGAGQRRARDGQRPREALRQHCEDGGVRPRRAPRVVPTSWSADCWDVPSAANNMHACNMCTPSLCASACHAGLTINGVPGDPEGQACIDCCRRAPTAPRWDLGHEVPWNCEASLRDSVSSPAASPPCSAECEEAFLRSCVPEEGYHQCRAFLNIPGACADGTVQDICDGVGGPCALFCADTVLMAESSPDSPVAIAIGRPAGGPAGPSWTCAEMVSTFDRSGQCTPMLGTLCPLCSPPSGFTLQATLRQLCPVECGTEEAVEASWEAIGGMGGIGPTCAVLLSTNGAWFTHAGTQGENYIVVSQQCQGLSFQELDKMHCTHDGTFDCAVPVGFAPLPDR